MARKSEVEYETFDECEVRREGKDALLIYVSDVDKELWVPKSLIGGVHTGNELREEGDTGTLAVEDWFAKREING